ncbi:lytic transglycosylase domain-containing protein, partial [Allomesorhizobium alhagi]
MAKRFSHLPTNRLLAAAMAAAICLIGSESVSAGEQLPDSADLQHFGAVSSAASAASVGVEDIFEARWTGDGKKFSIGADGKARAAPISAQDAHTDTPLGLPQRPSPNDAHSQIDIFYKSGDQECGPSPMTAPDIARIVAATAEKHGVDPDFALAVATAESRLDRHRNSPKGARGPTQLMPMTADRFGVDDICDPVANIAGGVRYLRELFDRLRN